MAAPAPVYRNAEASNMLLGLAVPTELTLVLGVAWIALYLLPLLVAVLLTGLTYGGIRALHYGKAPGFLQDWLGWQMRRALSRGRLSAAARQHRLPRFPYASYLFRDVPPGAP